MKFPQTLSNSPDESPPPPKWFADELARFAQRGNPERVALLRSALKATGNNFPDAELILADTLSRALRFHRGFQRGTSMQAWLKTMLTNLHIAQKRSQARRERTESESASRQIEDGATVILDAVYGSQRRQLIASLPAGERRVISSLEKTGSFDAAAEELGLSLQSVKDSLNNAVATLSKMEGEEEAPKGPSAREKDRIEAHLSRADLEKLLSQLSPTLRETYAAVVIERMSKSAAAARFGVAEITIRTRLSKARDKLAVLQGIERDKSTQIDRLREWHAKDPQRFEKAMGVLAAEEREIVQLLVVARQSRSSAAESLGTSLMDVSFRLSRAYRKLLYQLT